MTWREAVLHYGKIAYEQGLRLEFNVIKRFGERRWRIELKQLMEHGEDKLVEDD